MSLNALDLDVEAITPQKDVGGGEGDALIAVEEAVVVAERLHERGRFFFEGIVIADLRTKNGGLNQASMSYAMETAEQLDEPVLHPVDFRHRKVIRHLPFTWPDALGGHGCARRTARRHPSLLVGQGAVTELHYAGRT